MVAAGVHIVPLMPSGDVIAVATEAERLGYDYCLVADEGFHPDVYACLGAIARATDRITLGVLTNAYTRHPAVTAAAAATVNELSGGRLVVTLLAGGSMVLSPMGIERSRPARMVADCVQVLKRLWSGEEVSWSGQTCSLDRARLGMGPQPIPIWIAGRGPRLLELAGRQADGVILTVKPDLGAALSLVESAAAKAGRPEPQRFYLGRICYTPELIEGQRRTLSFVLMDSPRRVLESLGLTADEIYVVEQAAGTNRPELVDELVTGDLLRRYQASGTTQECRVEVEQLARQHSLSGVLIDALSSDLGENLAVLADSLPIIHGARP
ncbi:MAG: LLM class flavin-dependent oxidoreductase [Acidimicrobiaceae bacterium]|nr:LLM class flavin-dependent oxidoreductase [Acidimicrobiaceae bacterium]